MITAAPEGVAVALLKEKEMQTNGAAWLCFFLL